MMLRSRAPLRKKPAWDWGFLSNHTAFSLPRRRGSQRCASKSGSDPPTPLSASPAIPARVSLAGLLRLEAGLPLASPLVWGRVGIGAFNLIWGDDLDDLEVFPVNHAAWNVVLIASRIMGPINVQKRRTHPVPNCRWGRAA